MAKVLCALSGIEYSCDHFPAYLSSREHYHPVFSIPQKKLLSYTGKWAAGELTSTDSYLLFLALLNSTEQVEFRVPASRTPQTDQIVANNMQDLLYIVGKINLVKSPQFVIPSFVISPETKTLETVHYWIAAWESCLEDFTAGYAKQRKGIKLHDRETALEKMIRSAQKDISHYAGSLAEWAAIAGDFPDKTTQSTPFGTVTISEYWKAIIRKCCRAESIFTIPLQDLTELIEHCEENIDHGTIFAFSLMNLLKQGKARHSGFLGLTDLGDFQIMPTDSDVEAANIALMIQTAPESEPIATQYPNRISYLKAKAKYEMAQKHGSKMTEIPTQTPMGEI